MRVLRPHWRGNVEQAFIRGSVVGRRVFMSEETMRPPPSLLPNSSARRYCEPVCPMPCAMSIIFIIIVLGHGTRLPTVPCATSFLTEALHIVERPLLHLLPVMGSALAENALIVLLVRQCVLQAYAMAAATIALLLTRKAFA